MPDYQLPAQQNPDILGAYIRGQMAPGAVQMQQQDIEQKGLALDQLRQMMQYRQAFGNLGMQQLQQSQGSSPVPNTQGGPPTQGQTQDASNVPWGPGQVLGHNISQGSIRDQAIGNISIGLGGDPIEIASKQAQLQKTDLENAQNRAKIALQPAVDQIEAIRTAANPEQIVMANQQQYMPIWQHYAGRLGLNPNDPSQMTPQNVRMAATLAHNDVASQSMGGIEPLPMPTQLQTKYGAYGSEQQIEPVSGKATEVTPMKLPTYDVQKRFNTQTGKEEGFLQQTGGWGAGGAPGGPQAKGGGTIDLGMTAPTTENIKQAGFAATMANGLKVVRGMEQNGGSPLGPKERALLVQVATAEDVGDIHQLGYQMGLKHLSGDQQAYLAGMMPIIQAVSHDQSGARLNSSQIRSNLESVIPQAGAVNPKAYAMINSTRDAFQSAMNVGSGSAAYTPEFNNTIGAQRRAAAAPKVVTQAQVQAYAQQHKLSIGAATQHVQANGFTIQ